MNGPCVMLQLSRPERGFRHTVDSALQTLLAAGIALHRVTLRMTGAGWPTRSVVAQTPHAGLPIAPDQMIVLSIAGSGVFQDLPVGMWERGSEAEPGTQELLEPFDDPLQKAGHWMREGARLFDIRPDNLPACARWLQLFGVKAAEWPKRTWYDLALLLPSLHRLAGTERGVRMAVEMMLRLPLKSIDRLPNTVFLARDECSFLGNRHSRLGVDTIAGDRREDLARWRIVLGPVELEERERYATPEYEAQLEAVLGLVMPCYRPYIIDWLVLDARYPVRLGSRINNGVLAVNTWLGRERYPSRL